ncbi:glycoside hydrolase family 27 protein [Athelia psychrophila]|uniref:Alpha-galactosidase n=1 Tax=Athelia psychrophila TaxID=1759441 RepID=A0A166WIY6_9AGAM|nr:glycoside hydrolase family 27 protein [Fibularhizoctonia sp. CBS 109695]
MDSKITPRTEQNDAELNHIIYQDPSSNGRTSRYIIGFLSIALLVSVSSRYTPQYQAHTEVELGSSRVGRLPAMGYNTWNAYHCEIDEDVVLESAKYMKSLGLDAGYTWYNIDDCYSERNRTSNGDIIADKTRFSKGMKHLTREIRNLGMKAGIYSDAGWFTCAMYPGSYGNEVRDVKTFRDWGFDYLKFDNCAVPFDNITRQGITGRYERIAKAVAADYDKNKRGSPMHLSLCLWGREQPELWARKFGQSWRTTGDIEPKWSSVASIITQNQFIAWASDFYGHNDMDILEVGNGELTYEEAKTHFTAWALMKSPLLVSCKLSTATKETLSILTNHEIIALNQDPIVGTGVTPFRWGVDADWTNDPAHPAVFWSGQSQNGTVFMLINSFDYPVNLSFNLTESPWIRAGRQYTVRDLWTHTSNGTAVRNFTASAVPAHGVVALLMQDAGDEPAGLWPPCAVYEWCTSEDGKVLDREL